MIIEKLRLSWPCHRFTDQAMRRTVDKFEHEYSLLNLKLSTRERKVRSKENIPAAADSIEDDPKMSIRCRWCVCIWACIRISWCWLKICRTTIICAVSSLTQRYKCWTKTNVSANRFLRWSSFLFEWLRQGVKFTLLERTHKGWHCGAVYDMATSSDLIYFEMWKQ